MPGGLAIPLATGLAIWMLIRPGYEVGLTAILLAGLLLFGSSHVLFDPLVWWILWAAYLCLRLSMVSCLVNWTSWVELRAILTWRDAVIVGLTVMIGCSHLIPGSGVWPQLLGIAGILLAAIILRLNQSSSSRSRYTGRG